MFNKRITTATIVVLINGVLAGCASKEDVIPKSDITAEMVFDQTMGGGAGARDYRIMTTPQMAGVQPEIDVYELHNSPKPRYQVLPNPTLYIFVPAHLTGKGRSPVPAYITETKMFERDEYALPGELYPLMDVRYDQSTVAADNQNYNH